MRRIFVIVMILLYSSVIIYGQTKSELEEKRKKTLEEIGYVDDLLKSTEKQKDESMNAVKIIGKKLNLRESVIKDMKDEIELISERIDLNTLAIDIMEDDLLVLKRDYSNAVVNSYKSQKLNTELIYVLSAKDFNQGYKRFKYLQQVTKFRRNEAEVIAELKGYIELSKQKLQGDLVRISELKTREEMQKLLLKSEQEKKQNLVRTLSNKERQLRADLEEKKKIAKKIEGEIARIIEEERKKATKTSETPEQRLIGEGFAENKGRLPWPVERGIITSQFGEHQHPVLKYVTENNVGIEITSSGTTSVRAIFKGEVARVFAIQGANMTVIIRHGKYFTAYQNIIDAKVKPGDKVETKQDIGTVYCDTKDGSKSILKFMIFLDKEKLDPEQWISKK
jgi:murein hydrolase activator